MISGLYVKLGIAVLLLWVWDQQFGIIRQARLVRAWVRGLPARVRARLVSLRDELGMSR